MYWERHNSRCLKVVYFEGALQRGEAPAAEPCCSITEGCWQKQMDFRGPHLSLPLLSQGERPGAPCTGRSLSQSRHRANTEPDSHSFTV